jgi:plasmid stability protein
MQDDQASRIMARTTINLDPAVVRELKRRGTREGKTMGQVASELLASAIADARQDPAPEFRWTAARLGLPKVDLEDKEAVRRTLDRS